MEENFINFKPGDELSGEIIRTIYCSSNNYIVYATKKNKNAIYYKANSLEPKSLSQINSILVEINGLSKRIKKSQRYNSEIAHAYAECFEKNQSAAINILENLKILMNKDFIHQAKINYILCNLILIVLNTLISLSLYYTKSFVSYGPFIEYFTIATFGSYGGFLSTIFKINNLNFEEEGNKNLLFYLAISRVFISMVSSIIIYVLIKSNLLLCIFNKEGNVYVFYMFAIVAGFSESFIPDILKKIQNSTDETKGK